MLEGISTGSVNSIKTFTAANAFKAAQNALNNQNKIEDNTPSGVDLKDNNILLKDQNLDEIRDIAKFAGKENLTDEEIKYGLTYGRSVIADYCF